MNTPGRIHALILAAGPSSRLGQPKQAVCVDGEALLSRAVRRAAAVVDGAVHVVLGAGADDLAPLAGDSRVHRFDDWSRGQHASLEFGLGHVSGADAALVMPCDQYRVTSAALATLVGAWRAEQRRPAAASYEHILGVPVVWPSTWFERLKAAGRGQRLLTPENCTAVPIPEAAYDVDTPADLAVLG